MRRRDGDGPRTPKPYNPLEKLRLAQSIVRELLDSEPESLPPHEPFVGAGIYLIYYKGTFSHYEPLSQLNKTTFVHPIYVGQAVTPGGRRGGFSDAPASQALFARLSQHAGSIRQVTTST